MNTEFQNENEIAPRNQNIKLWLWNRIISLGVYELRTMCDVTLDIDVSLHELVETKFPHLKAWWGHMLENVHWVTLSQKKSLYRTLTFWGRCG